MAEGDISALRDMLCSQQRLLQKLYNELDAEREASSTAASEALSVILRLQGEKAAVKMEAEQYKRVAEEKISHAEESLEIFEDVIYQKEMELADLDYQLRSCRYKLLSMGCTDPSVGEERLPENHSRNETPAGESSLRSIGRRNSTPVLLKGSFPKKGITDRDVSTDSTKAVEEKTHELNDQALFNEKKIDNIAPGHINSYWEQIRLLEDRVKEIAGIDYGSSRNDTRSPTPLSSQLRTRSPSPQLSASNSFGPNIVATVNENGQTKSPKNSSGYNSTMGSPGSVNVHDVFEVPRVDQNHKACHLQTKDEIKTACQGNESVDKAGCVHPETVKLCDEDEPLWLKKLLKAIHPEMNHLSTVDCRLAIDRPTTSISELNQRIGGLEILDSERPSVGREATNRMEELKLLNDIKEQINSLHCEIKSWEKIKNSSCQKQEPSLVPLMEDMLHFWL